MKKKILLLVAAVSAVLMFASCAQGPATQDAQESLPIASSEPAKDDLPETQINVTVPTMLPITAIDGIIRTATEVPVTNNSSAPVKIADIEINATEDWKLTDSYDKIAADEVNFAVTSKGREIPADMTMKVGYDALLANVKRDVPIKNTAVTDVVFVIGRNQIETCLIWMTPDGFLYIIIWTFLGAGPATRTFILQHSTGLNREGTRHILPAHTTVFPCFGSKSTSSHTIMQFTHCILGAENAKYVPMAASAAQAKKRCLPRSFGQKENNSLRRESCLFRIRSGFRVR